jgi:hypothetical protein
MDGMLWDSPLRCDRCGLWSTNLPNPADLASPGVANGVCRAVLDRTRGYSGFEKLIQIAPQATPRPVAADRDRKKSEKT